MNFKTLLKKSLLLVAGLAVGTSAWADWTTLYSNDYETESKISDICSGDYKDCYITDATNHYLKIRENGRNGGSKTLTFPSYTTTAYSQYQLSFKVGFYTSNNKGSSFQLRNGSTALATFAWGTWDDAGAVVSYTIGSTKQAESLTAVKQTSGTRASDTNNTITKWYTFTITGSEDAGNVKLTVNDGSSNVIENSVISATYVTLSSLYFVLGNAHAEIGFDDMLLRAYSDVEVVPNPSAEITGANGTNRTVTMTLGTGSPAGSVIKYYTDTESKSDLATYSAPITVTSTSTIYYYAESTSGTKSEEQSINVTCEAITLNAPTITRSGNTVTISDNQSGLIGSPVSTIYYSYDGSTPAVYSSTITVTKDATITAYSQAAGYTNSAEVSRAVALFPAAGITEVENVSRKNYTNGGLTRGSESTVSERTYSAIILDGEQWGTNVYFQNAGWNFRYNNTWYIGANDEETRWLLMKSMKAGDIIVVNMSNKAASTVNATYSEKYTEGSNQAYIVDADGDVELGFARVSKSAHNYIGGVKAYTHSVTGTAIGATDCSTAWKGATTTPVTLKPGDSYRYQFINYTNGGGINDQNWQLIVANADNSADILEIRADWWENLTTNANHQIGFASDAANYWTNVPSKMNGATVDMTITFNTDKTLTMTSTTTAGDATTWTYSYNSNLDASIDLTSNSALTVYLTVAKNWLDLTSESQTAVGATIADSRYSSLATDKGLNFAGITGLTAYVVTNITKDAVTLTSVDEIPANQGVILKGTAGAAYSIPVKADAAYYGTNKLQAAVTATTLDDGKFYILQGGAFHLVEGTTTEADRTVPAGKAYLLADDVPTNAPALNFIFADSETTGVGATLVNNGVVNNEIFNLSGQRVKTMTKGLYIVGGKKVVVK